MDTFKPFLTGLRPSPPPDHIWQDWAEYGMYSADQHRSTWDEHTHDCTQLTIALEPATVCAEWHDAGHRNRRELSGDMVWVVPPGVVHGIQFNRRAALIHFYFVDHFFENVTRGEVTGVGSRLRTSVLVRDPFFVEVAREVSQELRFGPLNELYSQSIATLAVNHLIRRYSNKPEALPTYRGGLGPAREKRIRDYIQDNLSGKLSLEDLAHIVEISPAHFASLFRQSMSTTPHKFVMRQRVEHARQLLEQTRMPLIDVAARCGFQDQSQFTTSFRRYFGITPGKYKRAL